MEKKGARKKLVIIGNGMAATACIEETLKAGPDKYEITVFGAEPHLNYNRVLLSYVLSGKKELKDISLHGEAWYGERGVKLKTGCGIKEIKRARRIVVDVNGDEFDYDKLIIATGSLPLMPPLPGIDKEGVFAFRAIDDCLKIKAKAEKGKKAVVIGGGILGLEAAYGLRSLGMEVTVLHIMEKLMERQLDCTSSEFLKEDLEGLGISVLVNAEAAKILGDNNITGVALKDGGVLEASLVVISVGIRPNADLARSSGIYCGRGIAVSDTMQTYDPAIYALGECIEHRGATFGLVGPIFDQARVIANHLAGDARLVFRNQPSSARLKIPGIELYSAGDVNGKDFESIEYLDRASKAYKKILIKDNFIKGIIMYGEVSDGPRLFSDLVNGADISARRAMLLFGDASHQKKTRADSLGRDAIICGCNGVTRGMITDAIEKKGLFTREDIKRETKASASCGGCAPLIDEILESTLGSNFQSSGGPAGICGCTKYTKDDVIKNIRERELKSVRDVMETLGWETVGCEKCRPAINYYISMVWPADAEDDLTSRLINERAHANIQKDGTFSVVPSMYGGVTTPEELKRIAKVAERYRIPLVKLTGGQRIALVGAKREDLPSIWSELGMDSGYAYAKALRTVKTCVGARYCRFGTQDSMDLGIELEKRLRGLWMPAKVKMSVSGCPRNCAESGIKDLGIVGISGGWEIYAGGCGGIELKGAERLSSVKTGEEVFEISMAFLQFYREDADYGERTFKWVARKGIDAVRKAVVDDAANRKSLRGRLEKALEGIADPWMERAASNN